MDEWRLSLFELLHVWDCNAQGRTKPLHGRSPLRSCVLQLSRQSDRLSEWASIVRPNRLIQERASFEKADAPGAQEEIPIREALYSIFSCV